MTGAMAIPWIVLHLGPCLLTDLFNDYNKSHNHSIAIAGAMTKPMAEGLARAMAKATT